jgi:pyrimidine-specific ribonucleoside hydrolase
MAIDVHFDMETGDPDDFLSLALLATHPAVALRSVSVNPGSYEQVGLVRHTLALLDRAGLPVGSRVRGREAGHVSDWHERFLKTWPRSEPDDDGHAIIARSIEAHPSLVVLTGGPLQNLRFWLGAHGEQVLARWAAQGGFAGDSLVDAPNRLEKFDGRETCESYNFGGDPKGALAMLESKRVGERRLVSKNVCHGLAYDAAMHARLSDVASKRPGLALVHRAMAHYLTEHPQGKLLHDPLAACAMIDPRVCDWREVEVYREKGRWGARPSEGSATWISVRLDRERFWSVFTAA